MLKIIFLLLALTIVFTIPAQKYADASDKQEVEYTVTIDDVLNIGVLGRDDLKSLVTVMSDGSISFPYIGTINVKGLTLEEIKKEITDRLANGYIKYPVVSVSIASYKSLNCYVCGEVSKPGRLALVDNMTVFKAISLAGGITPNGLYGSIRLKRKQGDTNEYTETIINLKGKEKNDTTGDIRLQPDDLIIVERNTEFFIYGEVTKPGKFTLEDNMTVLKAISLAGYLTPDGLYGTIRLKRKLGDMNKYTETIVNLKGNGKDDTSGDIQLQPDDVLIVERNTEFYVYGEVTKPGKFTLENNMTVLKAVALAGGFTKYGSPDKVKILRVVPGKTAYESIKVDLKAAIKGKTDKDIRLEPDDIIVVSEGVL
ncbi:MAG: wza [Candidatus Brocadiaceae bacterium]|nr:wza [Candidatus Brocadiaceae bacterium]